MSGTCLIKLPHQCGSSDGLQVFENEDGSLSGYCFACSTYVPNPYGDNRKASDIPKTQRLSKTKEEIKEEFREIEECSTFDLVERRLRKSALEKFGVKVGVDQSDGKTPRFVYFPFTKNGEITRWKVRLLEAKKIWNIVLDNDVDLFGWEQAIKTGARRLIITEGEYDAIALDTIIDAYTDAKWKDNKPAVVSLTNGAAGAAKELAKHLTKIRRHFKDVSFCFDNDEAGRKATEECMKLLPEATEIILPAKDANQCIIDKVAKAAHAAVTFNHVKPKNSRLVWLDDIWEESKKPAEHGVSWPWEYMTKKTRGIRKGETIYLGAAQKMGKSEIVNTLAAHLVAVHDWKILLAKPEEANVKSVKLLAGKISHAKFHDPDVPFDAEKYEEAGKTLMGRKVAMLNLYQHLGWDTLKSDIISAVAEGVDAVFIDPITNLTNGFNAADANTKLQEIAQELAAMAKDLNIVIFIFCHLRNPDSGPSHDRGGEVLTSQFAGSRAMGRSCNYMLGLEGNKDPSLPEQERNIRTLVILDDREFGEVGRMRMYWDPKTTMFNELRE